MARELRPVVSTSSRAPHSRYACRVEDNAIADLRELIVHSSECSSSACFLNQGNDNPDARSVLGARTRMYTLVFHSAGEGSFHAEMAFVLPGCSCVGKYPSGRTRYQRQNAEGSIITPPGAGGESGFQVTPAIDPSDGQL